jgi:hypothetical protein
VKRRLLTLVLVAAVLVAGSQIVGCRRLRGAGAPSGQPAKVELTFIVTEADPALVKAFRIGDPVRIKDTGSLLGKITAVEATPMLQPTPTAAGQLVAAEVPDQVDIRVTVAGSPVMTQDGYRFDGEPVWVNSDFKLVSTLAYCEAKVLSIKETGK